MEREQRSAAEQSPFGRIGRAVAATNLALLVAFAVLSFGLAVYFVWFALRVSH